MSSPANDWTGQPLAQGRYLVQRRLGEGGMALVYLAVDQQTNADVVVKAPRAEMMTDPDFAARFVREIRALVKLKHPNIISIFDVSKHQEIPFMVMQYLSGGTLRSMQARGPDNRPFPMAPSTLSLWLPQAASALDYIHQQGYLHRDVKPDNFLFDSGRELFLGDFGIAKVMDDKNPDRTMTVVTQGGQTIGTPQYMAPELILAKSFDHQVDQYALAITVFELLSGRYPYEGSNPTAIFVSQVKTPLPAIHELVPGLSAELTRVLKKALAKKPTDRYATCTEFAQAAIAAVSVSPVSSSTSGPPTVPNAASKTPANSAAPEEFDFGQVVAQPRPASKPRLTAPDPNAAVVRKTPAPRSKGQAASPKVSAPHAESAAVATSTPILRRPLTYILGISAVSIAAAIAAFFVFIFPELNKAEQKAAPVAVSQPVVEAKPKPSPAPPPSLKLELVSKNLKLWCGQGDGAITIKTVRTGWQDKAVKLVAEPNSDVEFVANDVTLEAGSNEGSIKVRAKPDAVPKDVQLRVAALSVEPGLFKETIVVPVTIAAPPLKLTPITTALKLLPGGDEETISLSIKRDGWKNKAMRIIPDPHPDLIFKEVDVPLGAAEASIMVRAQPEAAPKIAQVRITAKSVDASFSETIVVPVTIAPPAIKLTADGTLFQVVAGKPFEIKYQLDKGKYKGQATVRARAAEPHGLEFDVREGEGLVIVSTAKASAFGSTTVTLVPQVGMLEAGSPVNVTFIIQSPPVRIKQAPAPQVLRIGETYRVPIELDRGDFAGAATFVVENSTSPEVKIVGSKTIGKKDFAEIQVTKDVVGASAKMAVQLQVGGEKLGQPVNFEIRLAPPMFHGLFPYTGKPIRSMVYNGSGNELLTAASDDQNAMIWYTESGEIFTEFPRAKEKLESDFGIGFSENFKTIRSFNSRGGLIWDRDGKIQSHADFFSYEPLESAAFNSTGKRIVAVGKKSGNVALYDVATKSKLKSTASDKTKHAVLAGFGADERKIFANFDDGSLAIYSENDLSNAIATHGRLGIALAISPDRRRILLKKDREAFVYNVEEGTKISTLELVKNWDVVASFSPNGDRIITGAKDGGAVLYNAATGKILRRLTLENAVTAVALGPDSRSAAVAMANGKLFSWDLDYDQIIQPASVAIQKTLPPSKLNPNAVAPAEQPAQVVVVGPGRNNLGMPTAEKSVEYNGKLTLNSPRDLQLGRRVDYLIVQLKTGRKYVIDMQGDFDTYLRLDNPQGRTIAWDDDSGGNSQARIVFPCQLTGTYRIVATSYYSFATGSYKLTVREQ